MTPSEIKSALSERHAVALTLKHEAASEFVQGKGWRPAPIEHRIAVASVIRNRARTHGRFGQTFKDVCLKPYAFSCWLPEGGEQNFKALIASAATLVREGDAATTRDAVLRECLWIADGVLVDAFRDRVSGATHYYADWLAKPPAWSFADPWSRTSPLTPVAIVGNHRFYAGVR